MLPSQTTEALSTCARIDQWLDGQRALSAALAAKAFVTRDLPNAHLRGDNVTATVAPRRAA